MVLGLIRLAFCIVVAAFAVRIGVSLFVGAGLLLGAIMLYQWGCKTAAEQAAVRAYDQGADDALTAVEHHLDR